MKAQATQLKSGTAAAGMLSFINQRLALLERMAKLIEHHRALQAAGGAHQQRLHNLQKKITGTANATKLRKRHAADRR